MAATQKRITVLLVLLGMAGLAACGGSPAPPVEPGGLAIVGAELIDGTGTDPVADSVIVIRDDRIEAVGPRGKQRLCPPAQKSSMLRARRSSQV